MDTITILWFVLGGVSILGLIYSFVNSKISTLVGGAIGAILGLGLAIYYSYSEMGFGSIIILKGAILGCVVEIIISFFKRDQR